MIRLGQDGVAWDWGNSVKYLERGIEQKRGEGKQTFKKRVGEGKLGPEEAGTPLQTMKVGLCTPLQTMWFPHWYTCIDDQVLPPKKEKYLYTDSFFFRLIPQFKMKKDFLLVVDFFIRWVASEEECIWPFKPFSK